MTMNPPGSQTEKGIRDHRPHTTLFYKIFYRTLPVKSTFRNGFWKRGAGELWIYSGVPVGSSREVHDKEGPLVITALVRVWLPQTEQFYTRARFHYFLNLSACPCSQDKILNL
jgi:hypothetical protein